MGRKNKIAAKQTKDPGKGKAPLFSVIVPVFNGELFLPRLIKAIENQKVENFEIIFVDDQSTDKSFEILKQYQANLGFIQLFRLEKNSGAGVARNFGLQKAQGKYVFFNDCDDWIEDNTFFEIEQHLVKNEFPDVVVFPFSVYDQDNKFLWANTSIEEFSDNVYTGKELFREIVKNNINPSPWNKVFKKSLWSDNRIFFPEDIHHQDLAVIPYACFLAKRATILKSRLYNYYVNANGVTMTVSDKHVYSPFKAVEALFGSFKSNNDVAYNSWKNELIKLAFLQFEYNFKLRRAVFNKKQVVNYIEHFNSFCIQNEVTPNYLLNNAWAFGTIKFFIEEKLKRGIEKNILCFNDSASFEEVFNYFSVIKDQLSNSYNNKQELFESISALKIQAEEKQILIGENKELAYTISVIERQLNEAKQKISELTENNTVLKGEIDQKKALVVQSNNSIFHLEVVNLKINLELNQLRQVNSKIKNDLGNLGQINKKLVIEKQEAVKQKDELSGYAETYKKQLEKLQQYYTEITYDLSKNNESSRNHIAILENEKAWYGRTYNHLPKWYLKLGGIFRRLPGKK